MITPPLMIVMSFVFILFIQFLYLYENVYFAYGRVENIYSRKDIFIKDYSRHYYFLLEKR